MARIEINEMPRGVSFEEVIEALCTAVEELNNKRVIHHQTAQFGNVIVETYPQMEGRAVAVQFVDDDKSAPIYVRQVLAHLTTVGQKRMSRLERASENWYFVRGDMCNT